MVAWDNQRNLQTRLLSTALHSYICSISLLSTFVIYVYSPIATSAEQIFVGEDPWPTMGHYRQRGISYSDMGHVDWTPYCNYSIFSLGHHAKCNRVLQEVCQI